MSERAHTKGREHTPGPWFSDETGAIFRRHPSELHENGGGVAGDYPVAAAFSGARSWDDSYPLLANARLIAAAPDLLEQLRFCVERDPGLKSHAAVMAALAKASGEVDHG